MKRRPGIFFVNANQLQHVSVRNRMLTSTFHDVRYSLRALIKHRNFTVAALLTLALGIGINTSIFTLLYSVAFRPLPVKDADRVVNVYQILDGEYSRQVEGNVAMLSYPEYLN